MIYFNGLITGETYTYILNCQLLVAYLLERCEIQKCRYKQ